MIDDGHVERALREVIRDHGWTVSENTERLRASLSDVLGVDANERRREVDALIIAADEGVAGAVRDHGGADPGHAARLEQWGLTPDLAAWAVSTWVAAAAIQTEPSPSTDPAPAMTEHPTPTAPGRPVMAPVQPIGLEATALPAALGRTAPAPVPAAVQLPTTPPEPTKASSRWWTRRGVHVGLATGLALVVLAGGLVAATKIPGDDSGRPAATTEPTPPAVAQGQELVSDPGVDVSPLPRPVAMASKRVGVSIKALSEVPEMHVGGSVVLPPEGGRLIGFRLGDWDCQLDVSCSRGHTVHVEVDGQPRPLRGGGPYVVAVPAGATSADLVMTADGVTQRISLLTGRPSPDNIQALARAHRTADLNEKVDLTQRTSILIYYIDGHDGAYDHTLNVTVSNASLDYFVAGRTPRDPRHAFLSVNSWYTYDEDPRKASHEWAFDEPLLTFIGSDGVTYTATDLTPSKSYATQAFEVPADITGGRFVIGGPQTVTNTAANGARYSVSVQRHDVRVGF